MQSEPSLFFTIMPRMIWAEMLLLQESADENWVNHMKTKKLHALNYNKKKIQVEVQLNLQTQIRVAADEVNIVIFSMLSVFVSKS